MLVTVGLGGDGDEVIAIENAFARFGLEVPIKDAETWHTVGDMWQSLKRLLPQVETQPDAFLRLCSALCEETGADPIQVGMQTRVIC